MTEVQDKKTTTTTTTKRTKWVEWVFINLPFVCYLAFLGIVYIYNAHTAERSLRKIDRLKKEVMDDKWQYMNLKQELMYGSTQSQLAKNLEQKQILPLAKLPHKIVVGKEGEKDKKH
ncbi:MAG: FtsL-like putative cell division protein [Saprospiraceae bacterium]|jgi:hypothetical protein|nr:FtsL-like putative cell division protein [Saprospiraceae bacterium]